MCLSKAIVQHRDAVTSMEQTTWLGDLRPNYDLDDMDTAENCSNGGIGCSSNAMFNYFLY
jgi:hypothetical protein